MVYPATPRWQKRHGPDLVRGLFNLDVARVRWRGDATGGLYPLVEVYRLPSQPDKAEPVVFLSHLPPGSQQGPQADSDLLRHLAAASARQHRMMLSGYCLFDRYGTVNGRLIAPTLPVVQRNAAGYVLDARDKVIAERGAPTRRATHRRAVQTGARETNPEADRYPWLADRDLILLGYPFVAATPSARRNQRRRVHEAVVALRDRSALDFKAEYRTPKHGGKPELVALRLLPSAAHVEAHAARWAARKHNGRVTRPAVTSLPRRCNQPATPMAVSAYIAVDDPAVPMVPMSQRRLGPAAGGLAAAAAKRKTENRTAAGAVIRGAHLHARSRSAASASGECSAHGCRLGADGRGDLARYGRPAWRAPLARSGGRTLGAGKYEAIPFVGAQLLGVAVCGARHSVRAAYHRVHAPVVGKPCPRAPRGPWRAGLGLRTATRAEVTRNVRHCQHFAPDPSR